jgi:hypothetical protein
MKIRKSFPSPVDFPNVYRNLNDYNGLGMEMRSTLAGFLLLSTAYKNGCIAT